MAKPKVALTSEFCCTNGDYCYEIVKALREFSNMCVLPSDPRITMDIEESFVKCSVCGNFVLTEKSLQTFRKSRALGLIFKIIVRRSVRLFKTGF